MSMQTYPMYDIGIVLVELLPYLNKAAMEMYPEQYGLSPEEEKILQMSDADFIDAAKSGSLPVGFYDDEPLHGIFEKDSNTNKTQFVTAFEGSAETNHEVMETYKSPERAFSRDTTSPAFMMTTSCIGPFLRSRNCSHEHIRRLTILCPNSWTHLGHTSSICLRIMISSV